MKVKLKDKKNPIISMWCFGGNGYDSTIIDSINSGKQVMVERVPKPAWEYLKEVKTKKSKGK